MGLLPPPKPPQQGRAPHPTRTCSSVGRSCGGTWAASAAAASWACGKWATCGSSSSCGCGPPSGRPSWPSAPLLSPLSSEARLRGELGQHRQDLRGRDALPKPGTAFSPINESDLTQGPTLPHPTNMSPKTPFRIKNLPFPCGKKKKKNELIPSPRIETGASPTSLTQPGAGPSRQLHVPAPSPAAFPPALPPYIHQHSPGLPHAAPRPPHGPRARCPHPPSSPWAPSWPGGSRKGSPAPRRTGLYRQISREQGGAP